MLGMFSTHVDLLSQYCKFLVHSSSLGYTLLFRNLHSPSICRFYGNRYQAGSLAHSVPKTDSKPCLLTSPGEGGMKAIIEIEFLAGRGWF